MKKHSGSLLLTLVLLSFSMTVLSCGKMKRKGHEVLESSAHTANIQMDKILPVYNANTADTEPNKKRFREHLEIDVTNDVQGLYTYNDFLSPDNFVLMSFTCEQSTIDRIVRKNGLQLSAEKNDPGTRFSGQLGWWKKELIDQLIPYKGGEEDEYWQYLWYDPKTKQAFYEEFCL